MKLILTIFLSLAISYVTKGQISPDTAKYAILQFDKSSSHLFDKNYQAANLSEREIVELEIILSQSVTKYNELAIKYFNKLIKKDPKSNHKKEDFIIELSKYKRQFIAVINLKGEKEVWVNCFRPESSTDFNYWRQEIVRVFDGGHYFFNVKINLMTKAYFNFRVNGVA